MINDKKSNIYIYIWPKKPYRSFYLLCYIRIVKHILYICIKYNK